MRFIDANGEAKLIASDRNTSGEYVSIGRGLPVSALIGGKEISLYQSLNNAGYKVPILEYMGGGGWQALHAEKDPERNNINVLWKSTFPSDQPQADQVISFSIETGEWNGIYKSDGSYDPGISSGNGGARADCYVTPADPAYDNFLTQFRYISNPLTAPSNTRDNLAGTRREADLLAFTHAPSFGRGSADPITNFSPKEKDKLQIQLSQFGANAAGTFKVARNPKALGKALATSTDFIYLKSSGELIYNENGSEAGYGLGGVFARIEGNPVIKLSNIGFI